MKKTGKDVLTIVVPAEHYPQESKEIKEKTE